MIVIVKIVVGVVVFVAVVEIARAVHARRVHRRRVAAAARRRPTAQVVADRLAADLERRLAEVAPHRRGCACSPECWQRYVDSLDRYPWSGEPRVVRQRDRRAGA